MVQFGLEAVIAGLELGLALFEAGPGFGVAGGFGLSELHPQRLHLGVHGTDAVLFHGLDPVPQAPGIRQGLAGLDKGSGPLGYRLAIPLEGLHESNESPVFHALHQHGAGGGLPAGDLGLLEPAEILAVQIPVADPELDLGGGSAVGGFAARHFAQHGALGALHLHQGAGPEVAQALHGDVAHQPRDHDEGEGQQGAGAPDEGAASAPPVAEVHHQKDS